MLVTFVDKERPTIILKKEYDDILPLIEMTKNRGSNNILLDPNGDKTIHGRFYDYEYILTSDSPEDAVNERLAVYLDTSFNSITGKDIGK